MLVVVAVCVLASALAGMSGFGAGLIITLFITPVIGAKAVIPVMSVLMAINNASRVWFFRTALDMRRIVLVAGAAVPASALGAMLYVRLDSGVVQALLGIVLVLSVPLRRWASGRAIRPGGGTVVALSGVYGFLSSIIVGAGMLAIPILMGVGLSGTTLLATDAAIAVIINVAKMIFFGTLDALTLPLFALALVMGLCTIPGTWIASWIMRRTDLRIHTVFIEMLIVAGGAWMVVAGLRLG